MTPDESKPGPDGSPQTPTLAERVVPSYSPAHPGRKLAVIRWVSIAAFTVFGLSLVLGLLGRGRWVDGINTRLQALEAATPKTHPQHYDDEELKGLPPVVQRYLSQALNEYQPLVRGLYLEQSGTLNRSTVVDTQKWEPFTAKQRVATKRPGFVWDASVTVSPGILVRVLDAYVAGEGTLQPSVIGLLDLGGSHGTGDIARGELIRYFAESVWYPTVLLPSQGVQWKPIDTHSAQATLTDSPLTVTLRFTFGADGLVERINSDERSALVDGAMVPTPWEVRLSHYQRYGNMLVPEDAEVAWLKPTGRLPYWRGRVDKFDYDMPP